MGESLRRRPDPQPKSRSPAGGRPLHCSTIFEILNPKSSLSPPAPRGTKYALFQGVPACWPIKNRKSKIENRMPSLATQIPTFIRVSTKLARFVGLTLRPLAWIAAPCATLLVVAFILHECLAAHRWSAYRKEAANRGIALDLPKDPSPPIPDGENFAGAGSPFAPHTFADANRWLADMRDIHFRGPSIGRGERMTTEKAYAMESTPVRHVRNVSDSSPVSPDTFQPHTAEDFLAVCERNFGAQWPTILEAEARSKTRFAPMASPLPQPNSFSAMVARKTVQLHGMRAMAYLDLGRHEEALAEVRGSFQLAAPFTPAAARMSSAT